MRQEAVRAWLADYAWLGDADADARRIDCIISQDGWKYVDAIADNYAGSQFETGPSTYDEGTLFALSALYECHAEPHIATCPSLEKK